MMHRSTSFNLREKAVKAICPSEETLIALKLFARAFNPNTMMLSEN